MLLRTSIILVAIFFFQNSFAQEDSATISGSPMIWKSGTAKTLSEGRMEMGLLAPFVMGLKNNMEVAIHPLTFILMPNVTLKKNWSTNTDNQWQLASQHGITFPTPLLNFLAREGAGGVYPASQTAPPILTFKNEFIVTNFYTEGHSVSFKTGIEVNLLYSQYDNFPEVELLYFYPRMGSYGNPFTFNAAAIFTGEISNSLSYAANFTFYYVANDEATTVFEFEPKLYYYIADNFRVLGGIILTTGNVPHEKQDFRAIPFLDLQFTLFQKNRK
jgi:hypothetical protein